MLLPKKTKFRKQQRGRRRGKGREKREADDETPHLLAKYRQLSFPAIQGSVKLLL